ncbi:MAG: 30S ribosomal protein S6 [Solirubrobacteraceae bacterium]
MTLSAPTYDLTLLLDLAATDEVRAKIVADSKSAIESGGELIGHHEWGQRTLSYEIDKREQAEYHLLQFHAPPELLKGLDHRLRIADEVVRHRIIKLAPGTPPPPDSPPRAAAPVSAGDAAAAPDSSRSARADLPAESAPADLAAEAARADAPAGPAAGDRSPAAAPESVGEA